jgi:hypothetical protein
MNDCPAWRRECARSSSLPYERAHRAPMAKQHVDHRSTHTTDFTGGTGDQDGIAL